MKRFKLLITTIMIATMVALYVACQNETSGSSVTKYTLTMDALENGRIEVKNGTSVLTPPYTVLAGTELTLSAKPVDGYEFSAWAEADTSTTNPLTIAMTSDKTIGASFTAETGGGSETKYTLTVDALENGRIEVKNGTSVLTPPYTVLAGTELTLSATPDDGYEFSAWTEAGTSTTNPLTITMTSDKTIGASFTTPYNTVTISFANKNPKLVSSSLIGFNSIYSSYSDDFWADTEIKDALKQMGTHFFRWPGGAVTNRYHWDNLNGLGWKDNWAPGYNTADDMPETAFTDLDEHIAICEEVGATPLIGINLGSGLKYKRVQDGIEEAKELVQYCKDKGYNVDYYYLDNEPYHSGANYKMTGKQYAEQINLYAPAIKEINPNAKIVINWEKIQRDPLWTVLKLAGGNIDIVEIHWYWDNGNVTFDKWSQQLPMNSTSEWYAEGGTYVEEIELFYKNCAQFGYDHIELGSFEWNVGQSATFSDYPTKYENTIMQAEMLMQFIDGGLDFATMWPIFWPEGATDYNPNRYLMDPSKNYALSPSVDMFTMLSEAQGKNKYTASSDVERIYPLVVESTDKNTLIAYTHSKSQVGMWVSFKAPKYASVVLQILKPTSATNRVTGETETMEPKEVTYDDVGGYYSYYLPAYSLGLLKLSK